MVEDLEIPLREWDMETQTMLFVEHCSVTVVQICVAIAYDILRDKKSF